MSETAKPDLTTLTVQLLSAYVGNNPVPNSELAALIRTTRAALAEEERSPTAPEPEHVPAVSVKASIASSDHIISLIDGKPYKSLKRHLSARGLTPEEYRARYNLSANYPMVARGYSEQRRKAAKELGLGRKKVEAPAASRALEANTSSRRKQGNLTATSTAPTKPANKRTRKPKDAQSAG